MQLLCFSFLRVFITGRWPAKSAKFLRGLLKNAEANAIANELTPEDLVIRNIVVQQAPVRYDSWRNLSHRASY